MLQLQKAAYEQAKHLIRQRQVAIEHLASELINDPQETVQGSRIVEVLEATPVAQPDMEPSNGVWSEHLNPEKEQVDHRCLCQEPDCHGVFATLQLSHSWQLSLLLILIRSPSMPLI